MNELIEYIKNYANLLNEGSIWHSSKDLLAPVISDTDIVAENNYVYEFYCYISLIIDLMENYEVKFKEGKGKHKYKFPQAAANKEGKPRFHAFENGKLVFQICAGTRVKCDFDSEENHPDISFQHPIASEDPSKDDLILIMDAKFRDDPKYKLPKNEVYKFVQIVDLYSLVHEPDIKIKFNKYKNFLGNCLITNGKAYSDSANVKYIKSKFIKEIEDFFPKKDFNIIG